jgi:ABC-type uncharacterized transport system substrate-binding protein
MHSASDFRGSKPERTVTTYALGPIRSAREWGSAATIQQSPKHLAGVGVSAGGGAETADSYTSIEASRWPESRQLFKHAVKARGICKKLASSLWKPTSTVSGVETVIPASRGVQAIWIGGDNTVELAVDSVVEAARKANIPVFSNSPANVGRGLLFALGADYVEVGKSAGALAGKILKGLDPASVRIEDIMPRRLALNLSALKGLRDPWRVPPDLLASAADVLDENGVVLDQRTAASSATPAGQASRKWNIHFVNYVEAAHVEEALDGFFQQFKELGMADGRDYAIKVTNAQGDMSTLVSLIDNAVTDRADLILVTSTPTLQAAIKRAAGVPILFTNVANPILIGAGKSFEKHLPNVTGISSLSDFDQMVRVVKECLPSAQTIGTLFVPSEINSVCYRDELAKTAGKIGMKLISMPVSSSSDVPIAASSLASRRIDAYCQISDNLCDAAFPGISRTAQNEKIPLFSFVTLLTVKHGAAIAVARDYRQGGRDLATRTMSFLKGIPLRDIPFSYITKTLITINAKNADLCGLKIPPGLLARADRVIR